MAGGPSRLRALLLVALPVLLADIVTKRAAVAYLQPPHRPHSVLGEVVRLTLVFNRQGVMGLPVGPNARWILSAVTLVALFVLVRLYLATGAGERLRANALALIMGGACGNLLDRLAGGRGVVDFIDVGLRPWRFWTFNLADVAVDAGILLLVWGMGTARHASPSSPGEGT